MTENLHKQIANAATRIAPHILHTPLLYSPYINAHLKLESEQHTGSFKARGAVNKVLSMPAEQREHGLLTASTGNHALGFARALSIAGGRGTVYLPVNAQPAKVEALRHYGVELAFYGRDCLETELHAKQVAIEKGLHWVSPYNDPAIVAGQGTIGKEILQDLPDLDVVFATIGGGGLMSGVASWIRAEKPEVKIIGCVPENSPEMYLSVKSGEVITDFEPMDTLSDGSAGGCEPDSITYPICRDLVDDYVLVSEKEIADGIRWMVDKHHKIIEGAAGVALAAYMKNAGQFEGKNVAVVICGGNIATEKLRDIL